MEHLRLDKIGFVLQQYNLVPYLTVKEQFQLVDKVKKQGNLDESSLADLLKLLDIEDTVNNTLPNYLVVKINVWPSLVLCTLIQKSF